MFNRSFYIRVTRATPWLATPMNDAAVFKYQTEQLDQVFSLTNVTRIIDGFTSLYEQDPSVYAGIL